MKPFADLHLASTDKAAKATPLYLTRLKERSPVVRVGLAFLAIIAPLTLATASAAVEGFFRLGDSGEGVETVQRQLNSFGYPVAVDGNFGFATEQAVKAFQRDCGLFVDGVVGEDTGLALETGCERGNLVGFPQQPGEGGSNRPTRPSGPGRFLQGRFVVMVPTDDLSTLRRVQAFVPEARIQSGRFGRFILVAVYEKRDRYMAESQYRFLQQQGIRDAHMRLF
jgi:peptidoglycan hydrolase-like protein with peptidoglycan-binding domain